MDYIENYCFLLSTSKEMLDLRESKWNYGTMLIERSCTLKLALYSKLKSNFDDPGWCPLI